VPRAPVRSSSGSTAGQSRFEGGSDQRARDSDSVILEARAEKKRIQTAELRRTTTTVSGKEAGSGPVTTSAPGSRGRNEDSLAQQSDIAGIKRGNPAAQRKLSPTDFLTTVQSASVK
jgi:hypothetical protein